MTKVSPFELGAHTLIYRKESLERALQGIAQAGFSCVGLWTEHEGRPIMSLRPGTAEISTLRRRIEGFGLTPVTMLARERAMEDRSMLLADLDLCASLGLPLLQAIGPWPFVSGHERKPEMRWYGEVERFLSILEYGAEQATQRGVTIALKPHRGATATGADLMDVIHRVGSEGVRACWDAGNVRFYEGIDSEDDLERSGIAPLVRSVCIKDHVGGKGNPHFPVPGDGQVDHARLLHALAKAGFSGPLLAERVDQPTAEESDRALSRTRAFLQSQVDRLADGSPAKSQGDRTQANRSSSEADVSSDDLASG
ncbi:sugar phosphate isomerase/epimerase family protein [Actinopolymorpha pittospori]|uniref:Sugar phosphate isomerase/epimerase n=1 Tax=Actinopolymorpha pittospori TaxID=648752 RepID=A0A927MY98_9ACTN|nr:sugar phosphate isomerase/epimerase family protein [Actinopolymorpha pittospori]MBE1609155.1 sugar phosphate isomerase/epimerase [Actinopolymorpha pittospori]